MNLADEFELTPGAYEAAQFAVGKGEVCGFWFYIGKIYFAWDTTCLFWTELCETGLQRLREKLKLAAFLYFIDLSKVARRRNLVSLR